MENLFKLLIVSYFAYSGYATKNKSCQAHAAEVAFKRLGDANP